MAQSGAERTRAWRARMRDKGHRVLTIRVPTAETEHYRAVFARQVQAKTHVEMSADWASDQDDTREKSAPILARRISDEILTNGWAPGYVIGSETSLLATHRVSRSVLREAVRILEHQGIAHMRRGPGGGLIAASPAVEPTLFAVETYLRYRGLRPTHLFETRRALSLTAVDLAIDRLDAQGTQALEGALRAEREAMHAPTHDIFHDFFRVLGRLTRDPAIELFMEVMLRLTLEINNRRLLGANMRRHAPATIRAHTEIAAAIFARDKPLARARMDRHVRSMKRWASELRA